MDFDVETMDYDVMLCYHVKTGAIDWFLLRVKDSWQIEDVDGIDGPPWTPDRVREWTVCGLIIIFIAYVTYDRVYYDVVYRSLTCFIDGCRMKIVC
jgi:hypothetical protein